MKKKIIGIALAVSMGHFSYANLQSYQNCVEKTCAQGIVSGTFTAATINNTLSSLGDFRVFEAAGYINAQTVLKNGVDASYIQNLKKACEKSTGQTTDAQKNWNICRSECALICQTYLKKRDVNVAFLETSAKAIGSGNNWTLLNRVLNKEEIRVESPAAPPSPAPTTPRRPFGFR